MTQPTVTEWANKKGFAVTWHTNAYHNSVSYANLPALHAILTEKLTEMNSRKWVVEMGANDTWCVKRPGREWVGACFVSAGLDAPEYAKFEAQEWADRKNAEEGLS